MEAIQETGSDIGRVNLIKVLIECLLTDQAAICLIENILMLENGVRIRVVVVLG